MAVFEDMSHGAEVAQEGAERYGITGGREPIGTHLLTGPRYALGELESCESPVWFATRKHVYATANWRIACAQLILVSSSRGRPAAYRALAMAAHSS